MENTKNFKVKNLFIIIALIVIIAAIVIAIIFSSGNTVTFNDTEGIAENFLLASPREDKPILYIKNGALYSKASDGTGDIIELSGNLYRDSVVENSSVYSNLVKQSATSEITYFIKDFSKTDRLGSLFATSDYKTSVEIDKNIVVEDGYDYLKMSDSGKTIVYMKNLVKSEDELCADLYYKNFDAPESVLIAKELYGMMTEYVISPNGEYIAAYSEYNSDKKVGGLYILKNGEEAKSLILENTTNVSLKSITNDGKLIYTSALNDADSNKLSESVNIINHQDMKSKTFGTNIDSQNVFVSDKSDKVVYLDYAEDSILAYTASYDSEPVLITDKYYGFTSLDVENECYIFAAASGDEKYSAEKKVYIKTPELKEAVLLCEKISLPADVKQSADYKKIYYLSESSLYSTNITDGALTSPVKMSDNVHDFKVSQGGNSVVIITNYNEEAKTSDLKAYTTAKEKVFEIASGLKLEYVNLSVDGLAVVYADSLSTGQSDGFTAKLNYFDLYRKNKIKKINDKASMMFYHYDQYLASTTSETVIPRNRYYVRSGNSVLFYTDVGSDCESGNLVLFKDGKETLIDSDVMTVLFE